MTAAATATQASINASTGIATFFAGSGTTLADALADVAGRTNGTAGKMALFQVNATGDYYLFIEAGTVGLSANDVVVQLVGVSVISSITLATKNLTITAGTSVAPISIDLDHDGIEYLNRNSNIVYDYTNNHLLKSTAWVNPHDGFLAFKNVDTTLNIAFSTQAGETDLQGLAKIYDTNHDGTLDSKDANFNSFGVWQDANTDGVVQDGEFKSLTDRGILSLSLSSDGVTVVTADGDVTVFGHTTYTMTDGSTGIAEDVAFAVGSMGAADINSIQELTSTVTSDQVILSEFGGDIFKWGLADKTDAGTPAMDTVNDFNVDSLALGGDALDLRDLLVGESASIGNLANFLHFDYTGGNTIVHVSSTGQFSKTFNQVSDVQTITLAGVDLVQSFTDDNAIIQDLLAKQKLITD